MLSYRIVLSDSHGDPIDVVDVKAANLRLALAQSEVMLRTRDAGHGLTAASATVSQITDEEWAEANECEGHDGGGLQDDVYCDGSCRRNRTPFQRLREAGIEVDSPTSWRFTRGGQS